MYKQTTWVDTWNDRRGFPTIKSKQYGKLSSQITSRLFSIARLINWQAHRIVKRRTISSILYCGFFIYNLEQKQCCGKKVSSINFSSYRLIYTKLTQEQNTHEACSLELNHTQTVILHGHWLPGLFSRWTQKLQWYSSNVRWCRFLLAASLPTTPWLIDLNFLKPWHIYLWVTCDALDGCMFNGFLIFYILS